ncbi:MAG TPA: hypothetical protein VFJ65_10195 [Solirubrobacterales bacterium]|nr:hypothetical protein [Solirubrobacterales bacterium]
MKRLKGPELKLSELKVPQVLQDLYWDLRDRRLLPLIALVIVAIVAVPFLLGEGEKPAEKVTPPPTANGSSAREASLTVLPAEPGLREPSKRLAHRSAKNPFKQKFTSPVFNEGSAPIEEGSGGESSVTGTTGTGGGSTTPESVPVPVPSGSGSLNPGEVQLYSFGIDISIAHTEVTESGAKKMGAPEIRKNVVRGKPLPGKKAPVLTFLGVDTGLKNALMLVSTEATSLFGDNECAAGTATCQLLTLEPETPEIVEYGENGARYKFELLKVEPIKGPKLKEPLK